jgi:hypothetical protein
MENMTADHPMIKVLKRFCNGQRTDVAKGIMTNSDFIALCLYAFGPFGGPELRRLCGLWRGASFERVLDSYFTPHYGYTATDFTGRRAYTGMCGKKKPRRRYWYRKVEHAARVSFPGFVQPMRRYQNALTMAGVERAEQLMCELARHAMPELRL